MLFTAHRALHGDAGRGRQWQHGRHEVCQAAVFMEGRRLGAVSRRLHVMQSATSACPLANE